MKTSIVKLIASIGLTSALISPAMAFSEEQEYACTVFLCLANPNGATAEKECKPPIAQLTRDLAKGKSFPVCNMVGNNQSRIDHIRDYYDKCPDGTKPFSEVYDGQGGAYVFVATGTKSKNTNKNSKDSVMLTSDKLIDESPDRLCVNENQFIGRISSGKADAVNDSTTYVFEEIFKLERHKSPDAFDVYIDGKFFHRARIND